MDEPMLEEYAKFLDELKVSEPEKYEELMAEFAKAAGNKEMDVKMPDGEHVLGKDGLSKKQEGIPVDPDPGFVIKTKDAAGQKVFVNVCGTDKIKNFSKKKQLDANGVEQEGVSVPISIGPRRPDSDKAGKPCSVYDVIVNTQVVEDTKTDKTGSFRHFICQLALTYINQKYSTELDQRYKLPRIAYKGSGAPKRQYIRASQAPTIEEVDETASRAAPKAKRTAASASPVAAPPAASVVRTRLEYIPHRLSCGLTMDADDSDEVTCGKGQAWAEEKGGLPCAAGSEQPPWPATLIIRADLSYLLSLTQADQRMGVELSSHLLVIQATGYRKLELFLPYAVHDGSPMADSLFTSGSTGSFHSSSELAPVVSFDHRDGSLTVKTVVLPRQNFGDITTPDPGSKAWLLVQALEDSYGDTEGGARAGVAAAPASSTAYNPVREDDVLAEDAFHAQDMVSQHYLREKERGKEEKQASAAERDAERTQEEAKEKAKAEKEKGEAEAAALAAETANDAPVQRGHLNLSNNLVFDLLD